MLSIYKFIESKQISNYNNLKVKILDNKINIIDSVTGGSCFAIIENHFNHEKGNYDGKAIVIVRWDATPLKVIFNKGLEGRKDYIGGGFSRNALAKLLEIAFNENIKILEIFAPSEYSINVLNHYRDFLIPIPYSKAVNGNFYTNFVIGDKAKQFVAKVSSN